MAMMTPHVPEPGNPIVCMVVTSAWKEKMKKNIMKLKLESVLKALYAGRYLQERREEGKESIGEWGKFFIFPSAQSNGYLPAQEGCRSKQHGIEDAQPERAELARVDQYDQPAENVDHHHERVEHPQLVQPGDRLLELGRNVEADVVVEARLHRAERGQRGPIVRLSVRAAHHVRFPALQFARFALQLFLGTLREN